MAPDARLQNSRQDMLPAMANPYGIAPKPAWTEWAAKLGVSLTPRRYLR